MRFVVTRFVNGGLSIPSMTTSSWFSASWPIPPMPGKVKLSRLESRVCRPDGAGRSGARCSNIRSRQRRVSRIRSPLGLSAPCGPKKRWSLMSAGAKPPAGAPPPSACRRIPTASISSMKTMHWPPHLRASRFAFQARKRTMIASIPMNVCAKPEPGIETNGELKPVAIALASIVLPVPGAPTKSRPRSRLPPARSNASPDCQSVTTRRTSSFASSWPRTSASLTPHCASPGSKPRICEMPMISIGPMKIAKLAMKRKKTKTTCTQSAGVVMIVADPLEDEADRAPPRAAVEEPDDRVDRRRGRPRAATSCASTRRGGGP